MFAEGRLHAHAHVRVAVLQVFDEDSDLDVRIDEIEFHKAMRMKFGYKGPPNVLDAIFRKLDKDGSGYIGFDEVYEFVRGRARASDYPICCLA